MEQEEGVSIDLSIIGVGVCEKSINGEKSVVLLKCPDKDAKDRLDTFLSKAAQRAVNLKKRQEAEAQKKIERKQREFVSVCERELHRYFECSEVETYLNPNNEINVILKGNEAASKGMLLNKELKPRMCSGGKCIVRISFKFFARTVDDFIAKLGLNVLPKK
jgi:hypothetical protein